MYKLITTTLFLAIICAVSFSQTLILKKGKDADMKYSDSGNIIVDTQKGIETEEKVIYLMAGFDKKAKKSQKVSFSVTGSKDFKLSYLDKTRGLTFSDDIRQNLEITKIEFIEDEVNANIVVKTGKQELKIPLKYKSKAAIQPVAATPLPVKETDDKVQNNTGAAVKNSVGGENRSSFFAKMAAWFKESKVIKTVFITILSLLLLAGAFWLGTKWKSKALQSSADNPGDGNGAMSTEEKEAVQLNLLNFLQGQKPKENYSFHVMNKIKSLQGQTPHASEGSGLQAEFNTLKEEHSKATAALTAAEDIVKQMNYNKYYLSFNNGLLPIFQDLEKARENLASESHFNELFNKILNFNGKNAHHPLLAFSKRDNYVLKSLNLDNKEQLAKLTEEEFFDKFVLWHCGNLINNVSKLYAYVQCYEQQLDLNNSLKKDGVKLEYIESAFNKLSKLLEVNFSKSIQVPILGKTVTNPEAVDKVDYSFVKARYFDRLPHLKSGTVYDFNKVTILNRANSDIVQKGQVSIKV